MCSELKLENTIENMGAQMVKEVASKTADQAGDGTTTATILAQSISFKWIKKRCSWCQSNGFKKRNR